MGGSASHDPNALWRFARNELKVDAMIRLLILATVLACALSTSAGAQALIHGQLQVSRAAKGQINLDSGMATFKILGWQILLADNTNGVDPAHEPITIGLAEERFLIPAGQLHASKNGKRYRYKDASVDRGVQQITIVRVGTSALKVSMKIVGADLSTLLITDPPVCLPFAIIIGDDDGFSGVSFDRPKPYPSKFLSIPGFCTDETSWPWVS